MQVNKIITDIPNPSAIKIPIYRSSNNSINGVKTILLIEIIKQYDATRPAQNPTYRPILFALRRPYVTNRILLGSGVAAKRNEVRI